MPGIYLHALGHEWLSVCVCGAQYHGVAVSSWALQSTTVTETTTEMNKRSVC